MTVYVVPPGATFDEERMGTSSERTGQEQKGSIEL